MAMGSRSKADTGHAIQKAAQLDHLLLLLLLAHLSEPQMSNRRAKKILDTFGKRRRMARALGLIDEATNDDLTAINAVRVVFAHAEIPVSFASGAVRKEARRFRAWKEGDSSRRVFDEAVARTETRISDRINALICAHAATALEHAP